MAEYFFVIRMYAAVVDQPHKDPVLTGFFGAEGVFYDAPMVEE